MTQPMPELLCLVLAAGQAQRFGANKCLTPVADQSLLAHVVSIAQTIAPTYVALGAYEDSNAKALASAGLQADIIHCPMWHNGMGATIAHSIKSMPASEGVLLMLADQYAVSFKDYERLTNAWRSNRAILTCAQYSGTVGAPAIFPAAMRKHLEQLTAEAGAKKLIKRQPKIQPVTLESAAFDLDFIEDLPHLRDYFENIKVEHPTQTSES